LVATLSLEAGYSPERTLFGFKIFLVVRGPGLRATSFIAGIMFKLAFCFKCTGIKPVFRIGTVWFGISDEHRADWL
jgi:hypothetical protein